jgi:TolA-binding protein
MKFPFLFLATLLFVALFGGACEKRAVQSPPSAESVSPSGESASRPTRKIQAELQELEQRENQMRDEVRKLAQLTQSTQASLNESIRALDRDLGEIEQQRKSLEAAVKQTDVQLSRGVSGKHRNWPWPLRVGLALVVAGAVVLLYRRLVREQGSEPAWVEDGHIEENDLGTIHYPDRMYDTTEDAEENPDHSRRDSL